MPLSIALKNRRAFAGAWAEKELPSSARAGRSLGRAGVDGGSQPTGNLGWEGCATAPQLVAERGLRPLGLARRPLLPSCSGEEEERPGSERWRLRSALSGAGAEIPTPWALSPGGPAQPRHRKVHASGINFSGLSHSPKRGANTPTPGKEPDESPVRAPQAKFFGGSTAAFS